MLWNYYYVPIFRFIMIRWFIVLITRDLVYNLILGVVLFIVSNFSLDLASFLYQLQNFPITFRFFSWFFSIFHLKVKNCKFFNESNIWDTFVFHDFFPVFIQINVFFLTLFLKVPLFIDRSAMYIFFLSVGFVSSHGINVFIDPHLRIKYFICNTCIYEVY